jgi:hypothetical protein
MKTQKRINPKVEKEICNLMILLASRSKNGKVSWIELAKASGFSRQALPGNKVLEKSYHEINGSQKTFFSAEKRVVDLEDKLAKSKAECERLKVTLKQYDSKYARWLYNATNANLSIEKLNTSIPESVKTAGRRKGC